jgi:type IV pilus assembly protein PilO
MASSFSLKGGGGGLESLAIGGKFLVAGVFGALVFGGYYMVLFTEVENQINLERGQVDTKSNELDSAKDAQRQYNRDLAEKARREQLAVKQRKILPDSAETPAFLSTLQTVATVSGVRLTSWAPLDGKVEEFYAKVPMQLKLRERFHQVVKFFHGVGQVDRIINMQNITVKIGDDAGGKVPTSGAPEVSVECLATAFRALKGGEGKRKGKGKKKKGAH